MDAIDREILESLRLNARMTFKDLGERVHLSANTVSERVRRLEGAGVIRGYDVKLDLRALGLPLEAIIEVKLAPGTTDAFEREIASMPGVLEATLVTGRFDYMLRVACRDQEALIALTEDLRARTAVQDTYSRLPLRTIRVRGRLD
ncbi:MAG: Lrp/AsnC family transcriptional regulator [Proteobacteria bacterium]|nr:Lrp/AsnC family transcriptional regulator [Pseudomonadota bacterium]